MKVLRAIYNFLFLIFFALSAPYYFMRLRRRGNWRGGFAQRFGRYDAKLKQAITNRHTLWMHAVSVGEVNVCTQIIRVIEQRLPNLKIVVSTTTTTGMAQLMSKLPTHVSKIYYPIDYRSAVSRALGTIRPEAIVLVEAEIWPNFLWKAQDLGIPTFLVNARLSDRSFAGYKRFGILFRRLFAGFAGVGAQNEADAARLRDLGCRPEAIQVVGSLKYDAARLDERRNMDVAALLRQLGVPPGARILIGGSTHQGEEAILTKIYQRLKPRFPDLFLVLVPRHFERCRELGRELQQALGLKLLFRSELTEQTRFAPGDLDALLVNTTGELKFFYEHATVIFIGKSLSAEGGQNPIEPGALGKAMIFGPHMQNFADISRAFVQRSGAVQVKNADELESAITRLLADELARTEMGSHALAVVHENLGAIERTVEMIVEHLSGGEIYVAPRKKPAIGAMKNA